MIQNGVPFAALIFETIVAILIITIGLILLSRYLKKKRVSTFYLVIATLMFGLAALSSTVGKYLDYFSNAPQTEVSYTDFTVNIAYFLVAIGNICLYTFTEHVFHERKESNILIVTLVNGTIAGLLLGSNSLDEGAYEGNFYYLIGMVFVSGYVYLRLFFSARKEAKSATERIPKVGFTFISYFGVLLLIMFLMFIVDLVIIQVTGQGYSIGYYLGWTCGVLACISGYLGYVNPSWFRRMIGGGN